MRRRNTRRQNPGRGSLLLVNPRRKRRTTTKRRKAYGTKRRNPLVIRSNKRRRNLRVRPARRRTNSRRRNTSRRNPLVIRRNYRRRKAGARRRRTTERRTNVFKRRTYRSRRAPKVVYKYRNRRRNKARKSRKRNTRRRNPTVASMFKSIPFIGPILANMVGFFPQALFGAVSVEPTMWIAKMLSPYLPQVPASVFYAVTGLLVAAAVQMIPGLSASMKKDLAIAASAAAGGVAYYKMRTGVDAEMGAEAGLLELRGVGNLGSILEMRENPNFGMGYATMYPQPTAEVTGHNAPFVLMG